MSAVVEPKANRQGRLTALSSRAPMFWQKWAYTPLIVVGNRGQCSLNWRHPGASAAFALYVGALPLIVLANLGDRVHRNWISRHERAALRRRGLL